MRAKRLYQIDGLVSEPATFDENPPLFCTLLARLLSERCINYPDLDYS